ncbi:XdhC family protein [Streptomyces sp. J2-1]|uniref:XdhC family protein n=1 Tax=Streptomyces corallincola TaxID=2851888 RepID=UPI001C387A68|nr:XdhC/CoxI family protein [Streptomyces corallincola]MBV2353841.1 XdhC family protein [Streptomyces corallincola]
MLDIAAEALHEWSVRTEPFAVATVVTTSGSAPRPAGAAMAVDVSGNAVGSVSGGCVEGAVYELCQEVLAGRESSLEHFGYSEDDAFAVGLTCGGALDVFVQKVVPGEQPEIAAALAAASVGESVALTRVVSGPAHLLGRAMLVRSAGEAVGTLDGGDLDRWAAHEAGALLSAGVTGLVHHLCGDETVTLLVESHTTAPRLLIFGAIDFAAALARVGGLLGYRVTVCDARPVFATPARFPGADEVVVDWPHRYLAATPTDPRTVVCVLTHDAKFDVPLLTRALRMPLGYIGAMGSRRTHEQRLRMLMEAGVGPDQLDRLHSPIGLDLGAHTPEETALSIMAEVVARRNGATGLPLRQLEGPVHNRTNRALAPVA